MPELHSCICDAPFHESNPTNKSKQIPATIGSFMILQRYRQLTFHPFTGTFTTNKAIQFSNSTGVKSLSTPIRQQPPPQWSAASCTSSQIPTPPVPSWSGLTELPSHLQPPSQRECAALTTLLDLHPRDRP